MALANQPGPKYRVHVFFNTGHGPRSWTWCKEINGEIHDYFEGLPRCDSHADALAKALSWLQRATAKASRPVTPKRRSCGCPAQSGLHIDGCKALAAVQEA